jgi:16S rRNA G966 N2-methylase RsmD
MVLPLPDDVSLQPETYTGVYAMHKYWSRKPHNLVASYIKKYSQPGEIVLDAFCGSGVTVIESVRNHRRAIGIDLNPMAVFITQTGLHPGEIELLKREFSLQKKKLLPVLEPLYYTTCRVCQYPRAIISHAIWTGSQINEVWYACPACKTKKGIKQGSDADQDISEAQLNSLAKWYPTDYMQENSRINAKKDMRVSDLFTRRALVGLSLLLHEIRQITDPAVKETLELCFTASLPQASKMVFVIRRRGKNSGKQAHVKTQVGSWVIGYWIPDEHFEVNVWRCFENRFQRILKGKHDANNIPCATEYCTTQALIAAEHGYCVMAASATRLPVESSSVDYVFIDPPHGNRIPYLELSLMWNAWLGFPTDWENEIIVSEAKTRCKDLQDYQERLSAALRELWRVLKPEKYLSIAFNSLNDDTWFSLLSVCLEAGFEILRWHIRLIRLCRTAARTHSKRILSSPARNVTFPW